MLLLWVVQVRVGLAVMGGSGQGWSCCYGFRLGLAGVEYRKVSGTGGLPGEFGLEFELGLGLGLEPGPCVA